MKRRKTRRMRVPLVPIMFGLTGMSVVSSSPYGATPAGQATNSLLGLGMLKSVSKSYKW